MGLDEGLDRVVVVHWLRVVRSLAAVYSVAPPANIEEYVHRAGRAGRIGNSVRGGLITTLTDPALVTGPPPPPLKSSVVRVLRLRPTRFWVAALQSQTGPEQRESVVCTFATFSLSACFGDG